MATVNFTQNLKRHIECPSQTADGDTVFAVLSEVFKANPKLGTYVLDEQDRLRKHMTIAIDGKLVKDRVKLSDAVKPDSVIHIMQALSGG